MLKIEIQTVVVGTMHHRQVHRLDGGPVWIPLCLIPDVSQLIQSLFLQGHGLISQGHGLIGRALRRIVKPAPVSEVLRRIIIGMTEHLVLTVSDRQNAIHKGLVFRKNGSEGKRMYPCAAGFLFQKGSPSCISHIDGNVVVVVHLLQISADTHNQQALQGNMLFLAETHQALRRLLLQMENIKRGVYLGGSGKSRPRSREFLPCFLQLSRPLYPVKNRLRPLDQLLKIFSVSCLCLTARLVSQILFKLFDIRTHVKGIGNSLKFGVTVQLDHVPQKADQRLGV